MAPPRKRTRSATSGTTTPQRPGRRPSPHEAGQDPAPAPPPPQRRARSRRGGASGSGTTTAPPAVGDASAQVPSTTHDGVNEKIANLSHQVAQLQALLAAQATTSEPRGLQPAVSAGSTSVPVTPGRTDAHAGPTAPTVQDDTSPFLDALRALSDPGTLTPTANNDFMTFSFAKLDSSVSTEMRNIIHAKKFINLEVLLPGRVGAVDFLFNQAAPHRLSVHSSKLKKFNSFDDWLDAYLIFASVYIQYHAHETHGLLKHLSTVKRLHRQNFKWYEYDFEFRHFISSQSCSFDIYLPELLEKAKERPPAFVGAHPRKPFAGNRSSQRPFRHLPPGYCFSYARFNVCRNQSCQYKHECPDCGGRHSASHCGERKGRQQPQHRDSREAPSSKGANPTKNRSA